MASCKGTRDRIASARRRRGRMAFALVALVLGSGGAVALPGTARAASGGEHPDKPGCIWEQDVTLVVDGHQLSLPQATIKNGRVLETEGYYVHPDPRTLFLSVRGPDGTLYRAGLTVLEINRGRDSCTAYFAGPLVATADGRFGR